MKRTIVSLAALTVMFSGVAVGVAQAQPETAACSEAITKVSLVSDVKVRADAALKTAQDLVVKIQTDLTAALAKIPPDAALVAKLTADLGAAVNAVIAPQKTAAQAKIDLDAAIAERDKACKPIVTTTPTVTTTVTPPSVIFTPRPNVSAGVDTGGE